MSRSKRTYLLPSPWPYKVGLFAIFAVAYACFYIYPNFNPIFEPVYLPLYPVEQAIPLWPWTFFVYTSDYILLFLTIALISDRMHFHRFVRRAFLVLFLGGTVFFLWPTVYDRPAYPEVESSLLSWVMATVRELDAPTNCFPSLHVAFTGLGAWSLRYRGPKVFAFFALWSLAVFTSVLTTKQHYLLDIFGGVGLIAMACWTDMLLCQTGLSRFFQRWQNTQLWNISLLPLP